MSRVRAWIVVAVLFVAAVASVKRPSAQAGSKPDPALREWIAHPTASARVLISVRCHAASRVVHQLVDPVVWGNSDTLTIAAPQAPVHVEPGNGAAVPQ